MASGSYSLRGFEDWYQNDDRDIKARMKQIYNNTAIVTQSRWVQQSIDERFYAGDQSLWNEYYSSIPVYKRKQFNFNLIRSKINMVSGTQRKNRKTLNVIPIENAHQQTADQLSKVMMWMNQQANAFDVFSDAFHGALVTGMNLLSCYMDYRTDPYSGDFCIDNMSYNGFLIDPFFKKIDLSDCNYIWTRKYVTKKMAISLMPDHEKDIESMSSDMAKDGYFNFLPENYNMNMKDLLPYDEFYYLDFRDAIILLDPENEESLEWKGPEENLKLFLLQHPQIKKQKIKKQTVRLAIGVNNQILYNGPNPYGIDRYPFVPVMCYYNPELPYYEWRIQGIVRSLRDAQFIYNRKSQIILDIFESQINSGMKVMEDSLVDDRDAFKSGQGQALFIKKDAPLGMASVEQFMPPRIDGSQFQVLEQMSQNMFSISGINEELMGQADDDKAGILAMLRQGASLTNLQPIFDYADQSLKALGRLQLDLIQANFSPAKVKRIIGEEPTGQFYSKTFQKYDCEVIEGFDTATQRLQSFRQKLYLKEIGLPIPVEDILSDATFQNKSQTIEKAIQQEQMQSQIMQMQQQVQMQELQARTNLANARAKADTGLAVERASRVAENQSLAMERKAQAIKDIESAELDKIKAAKELTGMDLTHLKQLIEVINSLNQKETEKMDKLTPTNMEQM